MKKFLLLEQYLLLKIYTVLINIYLLISLITSFIFICPNKVKNNGNDFEYIRIKKIHLKKSHVKPEIDNAVDEFAQQLRTYIILYNFQLGDTLSSELEIAEKFSYARNTAREALGVLKAYGVM